MAQESKRRRRERRTRMRLNQALRFVNVTTLQKENEGLRQEVAFYQKQNFYSSSILKAVLAQRGEAVITKGTIDQAIADDQHVFKVDNVPGSETEYVVRLVNKVTVTDTTPASDQITQERVDAAIAEATKPKDGLTITHLADDDGVPHEVDRFHDEGNPNDGAAV